jgi:deoxycytidine triphosphate deaminase
MDGSYVERAIIALWMINIENLITNKVHLAKNFHIQPSEVDKMPMWEYEIFMKTLNEVVDEDNKKQQGEMDKYDINSYKKMANPSNMNKVMSQQMPKMPNMNFSMPKF